jgi:hypothetical protein
MKYRQIVYGGVEYPSRTAYVYISQRDVDFISELKVYSVLTWLLT